MGDGGTKDPFAVWRELAAQWEKSVNTAANQTMASDEFSRSMNGGMAMTMRLQEAMRDAMGAYLASINVASRNDVAALGTRLAQIEERLDRMHALLERLASGAPPAAPADVAAPPAAPRPPRTKRPPGSEPA